MASQPIAVITGGSRGIGAATAERLANDGYSVVVTYSSDSKGAAEVVSKIEGKHGKGSAFAYKVDGGNLGEIDRFVKEVLKLGTVKAVVANAAKASDNVLADITPDEYDNVFNVNFKGVLFLLKELAPHIPSGGSVVLISSGVTRLSGIGPQFLTYTATKGALEQMGRVLSKELMPRGIRINTVQPGPINTAMMENVVAGNPELRQAFESMSPANRAGAPEEVASVVAFFVGPDSSWVSGQTLAVDGAAIV